MRVAPRQRTDMDAAHRASLAGAAAVREPLRKNVPQAIKLGEGDYVTFRGRAYGVPPVPWKAGLRLREACLEAEQFKHMTSENLPQYTALLATLPNMLWSLMRPCGRHRRLLWHLGLLPNPLRQATEVELFVLARFFLLLVMKSSIGLNQDLAVPLASRMP